jgi:hypothetical protein
VGQEPRNSASGCLMHFTGRRLGLQTAAAPRLKCPEAETGVETSRRRIARVAELADAPDLGSGAERRGGSSPPSRIACLLGGVVTCLKREVRSQVAQLLQSPKGLGFDVVLRGRNSQVPLAFFEAVNYKTEAPRKFLAPGMDVERRDHNP